VLADEVVMTGLGIVPEVLPPVRCATATVPLLRRGQIAHHGLKPDVDPFRLVPGDRDLDAPVQIPGDRPILQPFLKPRAGEGSDMVPPVLLVLGGPLRQALLERAESEEEMLRLPRDRRRPVDLASGVEELEWMHQARAVVALIPPGPREFADRAGALDVAIREEVVSRRAERRCHHRLVDVASVSESEEDLL